MSTVHPVSTAVFFSALLRSQTSWSFTSHCLPLSLSSLHMQLVGTQSCFCLQYAWRWSVMKSRCKEFLFTPRPSLFGNLDELPRAETVAWVKSWSFGDFAGRSWFGVEARWPEVSEEFAEQRRSLLSFAVPRCWCGGGIHVEVLQMCCNVPIQPTGFPSFLHCEACEVELEKLKEEEKRERELIGFGTAAQPNHTEGWWMMPVS